VILFSSLLAAPQIMAQQKIDWPEATAQLNNLRPKAITCVGLIKRYGTHSEVTRAALDYADGKSEIDGIISGLTVALTPGGKAAGLPSLQTHLSAAAAKLEGLCAVAQQRIPQDPGRKGVIDEIAKAAIEPLVTAVSKGIAALYTDHRIDTDLTRKTIITQLDGARWPDFNSISSGP
jgi:hypothetical protein